MSSKPKAKAKSTPRQATQRDAYSRKALKQAEPSPSPEWLAEMVIKIMGDSIRPTRRQLKEDAFKAHFRRLEANEALSRAMFTALHIYRSSYFELSDRELEQPQPVPASLRVKEKSSGRVSYVRGCKIITGETRRDRAEEKYFRWRQLENLKRDDFDDMPEIEEGFAVADLGRLKKVYEKKMKNSLAHDSGQEAPKTGQKRIKNRTAGGKQKKPSAKRARKK